jgi:hypothetical protein
VPGTARTAGHRQRDVDGLLAQHARLAFGHQRGVPGVVGGLHRGAGHVHPLAGVGLGRRRQRADLTPGQRDRRAVAEVRGARREQGVEVGGGGERLLGTGHGVVEGGLIEQRDLLGVVVSHDEWNLPGGIGA